MTSLTIGTVNVDIDLSDMESDIETYVCDVVAEQIAEWEDNFVPPAPDLSDIENDIESLQYKVKALELQIKELVDASRRKSKLRETISTINSHLSKRYATTQNACRKSITFLRTKIFRLGH